MTTQFDTQSVRERAPGVMEALHFAPEAVRTARPGQFLLVRPTLLGTDPFLPVPMAALPADDGASFRLIWQRDGARTAALEAQARLGRVEVVGPFGNGFTIVEERSAHLVYEGIGAVVLASLERQLGQGVTVETFGDPRAPWRGILAPRGGESPSGAAVYAAGTHRLLKHLLVTHSRETPIQFVFTNAPMACGVGTCIACAVTTNAGRYARVCTEGPVFHANLFR